MMDCEGQIADFQNSNDGGARYILGSKTPGQAATYKGSDCMSELTDNERIDVAATRVLVKYKAAFEELAK